MAQPKNRFNQVLIEVILLAVLLLVMHLLAVFGIIDQRSLALKPKQWQEFGNVFTYILAHGDWTHLSNNLLSLSGLHLILRLTFRWYAWPVFVMSWITSGLVILLLGSANSYHVGISGVIYGYAYFLLVAGLVSRNAATAAISFFVILYFANIFQGIFPVEDGVSWQGHLGGAIGGLIMAVIYYTQQPKSIKEEVEKTELRQPFFERFPMQ